MSRTALALNALLALSLATVARRGDPRGARRARVRNRVGARPFARDRVAARAWIAWLDVAHSGANVRPVQDAVELMTNHHDPACTRGRDFGAQEQSALRPRWSQWESAHRGQTPATFLAAGFRERGVAAVARGDPAQVAAALSRTADDALSLQVLTNASERRARSTASLLASTFVSIDVSRALAACAGASPPK